MHPCARCATMQRTCCQEVEILVTQGDIARIAAHTGRTDFWERRHPEEARHITFDPDDPNLVGYTVSPDGTRRQLTRQASGDCTFLGTAGCTLPVEVRPVICRMYPYNYNEREITGEVAVYCPAEVLAPAGSGLTMLTVLGMKRDDGERWRIQFYDELREGLPSLRIGLAEVWAMDASAAGGGEDEPAPPALDAIGRALRELGHLPERVGDLTALGARLSAGERWDLVWGIAGHRGAAERLIALLGPCRVPWVLSDPVDTSADQIARILRSAAQRIVPFTPLQPLFEAPPEAESRVRAEGENGGGGASVLILHDGVREGAPTDESEITAQVEAVRASLLSLGNSVETTACTRDLAALERLIGERRPDVVFNLVESLEGHGRLCHLVPSLLDSLSARYTGASAGALISTGNKVFSKRLLRGAGLPTPDWRTLDELRGGGAIPIPAGRYVLKSVWEHASRGLDRFSVVDASSASTLAEALKDRWESLAGEGYAEVYIHGRELRITMLGGSGGPEVLPTSEILFEASDPDAPLIDTYAAKWDDSASPDYINTIRTYEFREADAPLLEEVERIARSVWSLFCLRGCARIDIRVDQDGRPWVIDVNANPSVAPDSGFGAALERAGIPYAVAIGRILADIPAPVLTDR